MQKIPRGEHYEKNKNMPPREPVMLRRERTKRHALLNVYVKVGPGKTGKIAVCAGDRAEVLSQNFCNTYKLSPEYKAVLERMLNDQMKALKRR